MKDSHQFGVDFGVQPGITNEVDNPSFCLLGSHIQLIGQHTARQHSPLGQNLGKERTLYTLMALRENCEVYNKLVECVCARRFKVLIEIAG